MLMKHLSPGRRLLRIGLLALLPLGATAFYATHHANHTADLTFDLPQDWELVEYKTFETTT